MYTALDGAPTNGIGAACADPPKKKSRFNRPSWASKMEAAAPGCEEPGETFSRSKETLSFLLRREDEERGKGSAEGSRKRRRMSGEGGEIGTATAAASESVRAGKYGGGGEIFNFESGVRDVAGKSQSPPFSTSQVQGPSPRKKELLIVGMDTSEEDDKTMQPSLAENKQISTYPGFQAAEELDPFEDEELNSKPDDPVPSVEYSPPKPPQTANQTLTPEPTASPQSPQHLASEPTSPRAPRPTQPETPDFALSILITSRLPDTLPLIVTRKLSQRLKEVRDAWVDRQKGLSDAQAHGIFLTWRGQKIFDFTTCKSLGIRVNELGEVWFESRAARGKEDVAGASEENAQVAFEAVTEELAARDMREKQEVRRRREAAKRAGTNGERTEVEGGAAAVDAAEGKVGIRIRLRAKGLPDYKLQVKPTTKFAQIVNAARAYYKVDSSKEVFLMLDGERLGIDEEMSSLTDIEQEDSMDVMIR